MAQKDASYRFLLTGLVGVSIWFSDRAWDAGWCGVLRHEWFATSFFDSNVGPGPFLTGDRKLGTSAWFLNPVIMREIEPWARVGCAADRNEKKEGCPDGQASPSSQRKQEQGAGRTTSITLTSGVGHTINTRLCWSTERISWQRGAQTLNTLATPSLALMLGLGIYSIRMIRCLRRGFRRGSLANSKA